MTAGTSLSEAVLGRPSLLQAAFTVRIGGCYHFTVRSGHQHQAPAPPPSPAPSARDPVSTTRRTARTQHWHPVSTTRTASSQDRHRRPLSLPRALPAPSTGAVSPPRAHSPHQHPAPAPRTGTLFPPRAQPAQSTQHQQHSQHQHPAPAPSTGTLRAASSFSFEKIRNTRRTASTQHRRPAPAPGTLSPPRVDQRQQPVSKARTGNTLLFEVRTP